MQAKSRPGGRGQDAPGLGTRRLALLLLLLILCTPPPAQATSALADLIASLETSECYDPGKLAAVYRETVLTGAGIDRAVARLRAYARGVTLSPEGQAACHLAIAHLQWRDGAIEDAVVTSDQALESSPTPEALLLKARLLDASGDEDLAREWYERAAAEFGEGDEHWMIRLRLAMMDASSSNVEKLEELASQRDPTFRNQAAVVLALLGHPDRAIALYQPLKESGKLHQQHMRLSEWALQAESHELAREQAWLGYATASVRVDRQYALSLLAESYRSADKLGLLLEDLASRDAENQDLLRLRVELLVETEDYRRAIELYWQLEGTEADIGERRRLVALYVAAGDTEAMVQEYRRMMELEPAQVQWYDGLATHYLNVADNDAALSVWEAFEERNAHRAGTLVEGARLMLAMGFLAESVAMTERHLATHGLDIGALMFLFDTWLDRGEDERALNALMRLEAHLPPDAAELVNLADAYERLSRPEEALRVFESIRDTRGELGYDEQVRLAWLYTIVDRKREALELWRDIWVGVESPARRSFAESQLLLLAAELGALGDMAVELEGMLLSGSANRNHMNLLVRIYTESGDKLSATETIDEYAVGLGEDEIGRQELLAQVYLLLEDYSAHDRVLRRLYEIDPLNRIDHIKSIIINLLTLDLATETNERFEEIERWIEELRRFDEESVTGEFEASVYSAAGYADQAVEAYRRALVEQPENSDNLLLLADALDSTNRTRKALAILQFFAENAVEDNDFVVAVDGILNLVGTDTVYKHQPDPETLDMLAWTRRAILERIASRVDRFYLYELLADIAIEQRDRKATFVAVESSLAEAGLRRPAVLRQLFTMATPNAGFGGYSTGSGDIERQLKFGRRLVGLRQHLPPEVYIEVGKLLLAKEDVSGAERAFEMIDDITGMIEVDRIKAEIFEEAGYKEQSRVLYNRALNVNRDSLELLHKTGFLYEVTGREDVAFRLYFKAMGDVLRRLPTVRPAVERSVRPSMVEVILNQQLDATVSREYRHYYESLEQGLLLNWPEDAGQSERFAAELKVLFETELRSVLERSGEELLPLARYARLDRTARLIRRLGFYLKNAELAQYADRRLLNHFGGNGAFAVQLVRAYRAAGQALPYGLKVDTDEDAPTSLSPLRRQLALAEERGDFETQLQLLWLDGATDELEMLLGQRVLKGSYREGLGYGMKFLDEAGFKRLAERASLSLPENQARMLEFLGSDPEIFLKVEEAAGRPLLPAKGITALLTDSGAADLSSHLTDLSGHWKFLEAKGSLHDRVRYFRRFPRREFFYPLLRENLSESQRDEITDPVIDSLLELSPVLDETVARSVRSWLPLDANPANATVLYRIAEYAELRWPEFTGVRRFVEAAYEGRSEEAFRLLVEMSGDAVDFRREMWGHIEHYFPGFREALSEPRARLLNEVAAGGYADPELVNAAYVIEFLPSQNKTQALLDRKALLLQKLHLLEPEHGLHLENLIDTLLLWSGHMNRSLRALAREYRASPGTEHWRLAYFLLLVRQKRFQEALDVARDGGDDLRDAQVVNRVLAMHTANASAPAASVLRRLAPPRAAAPRPEGRDHRSRLQSAFETGDQEEGQQALREALRTPLAYGPPASRLVSASEHLRSQSSRVLSTIDARGSPGYAEGQLEAFLRALPEEHRKGYYEHYEYLARTVDTAQRMGDLTTRLLAQEIDDHEFLLWMVLRNRDAGGAAPAELDAFERRLAALPDPAPDQLLLAARILASAGRADQAADFYRLVAARMIQHQEYVNVAYPFLDTSVDMPSVDSVVELIGEIAARLSGPAARRAADDILFLARRADLFPGADTYFHALVLASYEKLFAPAEMLRQASRRYPGILSLPQEPTRAGAAKAAELIRAHARSGDLARAKETLGHVMRFLPEARLHDASPEAQQMRNVSRKITSLYGRRLRALSHDVLDADVAGVQEILDRRALLFPEITSDWPHAEEWINAITHEILGWLRNGKADQQGIFRLLHALGQRRLRMGQRSEAADLLARILREIEARAMTLGNTELGLLVSLANGCDRPLPFELVAGALEDDRLPWSDAFELISTFRNSEEQVSMLNLARRIGMDHGLDMLRLLLELAQASGETAQARDLQQRIEREEAAERKLMPDRNQVAEATSEPAATRRSGNWNTPAGAAPSLHGPAPTHGGRHRPIADRR